MNFYYDPILGLQYNFIEVFEIILDVDAINNIDIQEWKRLISQTGIMFVEPDKSIPEITPIITQEYLR